MEVSWNCSASKYDVQFQVIRDYAGFSWLTNLHGLAVDTVIGFEIVLPSGQILSVDDDHYSDLLWGLKGGLNNFVRRILLHTVW